MRNRPTRVVRAVSAVLVALCAPPVLAQAPAPTSPAPAAAPAAAPKPAAAPAGKPAAPIPALRGGTTAPATAPAPAAAATAPGQVPAAPPATGTAAPAAVAPVARPPVAELVGQMQKVYERTSSIKARFTQSLSGPMGKRQASGSVLLKKPGKMRWDYEKPERKLFVADGTTLWVYEPEDEQALKQPLSSSQLPAQVSFLFGRGNLLADFEITYLDGQPFGEPGDAVLKLVPKVATAQYKHLVFVVSTKTSLVKETVLYDQQDGSNHLVFSAVEQNPKSGVDDTRFAFSPPPGTKILNPTR